METGALFVGLLVLVIGLFLSIKACNLLLGLTLELKEDPDRRRAKRLLTLTYGLFGLAGVAIILEASVS